ncbi:MAG: acetyl-CoA C-acyltransferase [Proteobacteria bacterium]|nr:acetyl-CoA C-acyltransferase [Pseudomonadota bacterium]
MKPVVIAGYLRSPFTPAFKGELTKERPDEIAAQVIRALVKQTKIKPEHLEDIIMGCAFPEAEQGFNVARLVGFLADMPLGVAGMTINRFCGSSMQSIHIAAGNIQMGAGDAFICAGLESMSRVPMTGYNPMPHPELFARYPQAYIGMGETAENVAKKYKLTREEQDAFAVESHKKAAAAQKAGKLKDEIVTIKTANGSVSKDGCIRPDTSLEGLAGLKPAFNEKGTVTAGTSSPLTDGAAATLVCSLEYAEKHGLEPLAIVKSFAVAGCAPEVMGIGPVGATLKAVERAGINIKDIDIIELNEAFASQSIAVIQALELDKSKINLDGGAIALGHPLGATGARITGKAAALLKRERAKYALATQCIGGGQGIATVLEAI